MRKEKDFLGEIEIPDEMYYGVQTTRALTNFPITGLKIYPELIVALATVKCAAAMANMSTGRMDKKIGDALVAAAKEVMEGKLHDQFVTDVIQGGAGTSINMNTNEVLTNRALEIIGEKRGNYSIISPNDHANMAQSTNDAFPSAVHVALVDLGEKLIEELELLHDAFMVKAKEFHTIIKMGRTHLQDAIPITLGQEFATYAKVAARGAARIKYSLDKMHYLNMGGTAVGTGLNAEAEYVVNVVKAISELTGKPYYNAPDLIDATQHTDEVAELSSMLKATAFGLIKICNDLRLMASGPKCGFYEIKLPARQPGSSIMPGKVNPVMPESLNQTCYRVIGNDLTTSLAVENGQMELNVMEPVMYYSLMESMKILANTIRNFRNLCVVGIEANEEHCAELVHNSFGIMTAMLPHIGYSTSSMVVKEAVASDRPVKELIMEKGLVTEAEMNIILDPINMTTPGISGKEGIEELRAKGHDCKSKC
ncbi:MAG: aspartate ammonia-lyase [Clostridia bacterium]|mgnify:FL=1|nr:aspartate ammonia-lyase [Clostridia bacterium]MDD4572472.1 aspartate ammonia-lyase [Clostridia bacterium]